MIEGLVFATFGLVIAAVVGVVGAAIASLFWIFALPFKLLAWSFKGLGLLLALPFLFLFGLIGLVLGGVGFVILLIPAAPLVLLALLFWWVIKGTSRTVTGH